MTITKQEADTVYALARALEDTGRLCSLAKSDDKLEWRKKNQETQMRQLGEACISELDNSGSANGVYYAKKIRELIKEMLP